MVIIDVSLEAVADGIFKLYAVTYKLSIAYMLLIHN